MPRSGTTLLERTITAHPQIIMAAGELTALGTVGKMACQRLNTKPQAGFADLIGTLTPKHQYPAALGYLNAAFAKQTGWVDDFVNKLTDNSFNLGLTAALLPHAQVICGCADGLHPP